MYMGLGIFQHRRGVAGYIRGSCAVSLLSVKDRKNCCPLAGCISYRTEAPICFSRAVHLPLHAQGLGQSFIPTVAGIMELIMRVLVAIFLTAQIGFLGASLANPLAWLGAVIPLGIAY